LHGSDIVTRARGTSSLTPARVGLAIFLVMISVQVRGQDLKQIAPKPVPPPTDAAPKVSPPKSEAPAAANPNQVVIPELKGLVLQGRALSFPRNPIPSTGISIENLPFLNQPELTAKLGTFLGKPATFGDLQKIQQVIITWYRDHNRPFVDVTFPEQDVSGGMAQAIVTEFHLGRLDVEGNRWFSGTSISSQVRLAPGEPIDASRLQEDLDWINQNPFRQVSVVAEKSDVLGATDLVLKTQDRLPLRFYAGYQNTGTPALGRNYSNLGVNWGDAFGLDQQLSYQLTASDNFWSDPGNATFAAHSINYVVPLPWRDKLSIFGSYSQARPLLGPDLGLIGISGQASFRYVVTFPKSSVLQRIPGFQGMNQELQFGYDFKTSNNNLSFGGVEVSNVTTEIDQFPITYEASLLTDYGITSLINTLVLSPGSLTSENTDTFFQQQASNPFAAARYAYDTLNIVQTTRLPYDAAWVMRLTGQVATTNLLPSEQLGAGGHDSVRGYNERDANGSVGFLMSQELRSPPFSLLKGWLPAGMADEAQLLAFWDYGSVRDAKFTPGAIPSIKLSSLGLGARYTVAQYLDFRIDYGFQQRRSPGASSLGGLLQAALTVSY
jgi:hemolysin activation/secretion protein